MPCVAERAAIGQSWRRCFFLREWGRVKWSPGGSAALWGCHLTPRGPQQRGTQWTLPFPLHPDWLTGRLTRQWVSETADVAGLAPPNRTRLNIWSNSDIHFDIVQRRRKNRLQFFPKVQWQFGFVSLHPATRGTSPDTFPRKRYSTYESSTFLCYFQCFCCSFLDLLDCSWSDLLFISAMIKPFEFIKVLVSSVCTVPNARNTRRSTALGETPLIWYCARYPEPSNPTVDSVSVGCGCVMQRGNVHYCVPSVTLGTVCCMHSSTAASSSLQSIPNSLMGTGGLEGIHVLKRGKVFWSSKVFCCSEQQSNQDKNKRETSSGGH